MDQINQSESEYSHTNDGTEKATKENMNLKITDEDEEFFKESLSKKLQDTLK